MNPKSKEAGPVKHGEFPPKVRGGAEVVIPAQYTQPGSPFRQLPLASGVDARSLRYTALYNELVKLNIGVDAHMGAAELLCIYEKALLSKADEMVRALVPDLAPGARRIGNDDIERAAKALGGER